MSLRSLIRLTPSLKGCFNNSCLLNLSKNNAGLSNCLTGVASIRLLHIFRPLLKKQEISIVIEKDGNAIFAKGKEGDSVLDVVVNNEIDLGGYGACEGTLSCSTCHVMLSDEDFNRIPQKATDEELDMLDLAPDVCDTSRLGCQIYLAKNIEGLRVKVPSVIKDQREFPGTSSVTS